MHLHLYQYTHTTHWALFTGRNTLILNAIHLSLHTENIPNLPEWPQVAAYPTPTLFRRQRVTAKRSLGLWRLEVKQTESACSPGISNKCVDGRSANDTPGSSDWVHIFWMFVHWTVSITQWPVQSSITREMFPKLHFLVLGKEWLDVEKEVEASRVWRMLCTVCSVQCAVNSVQV